MTLFIPLGNSSPYQDEELRMALRSWERYSPPDRVIIIGQKPSWLTNVEHYTWPHRFNKPRDIWEKTRQAATITDSFVFANDDHFLLSPWQGKYYHEGLIREYKVIAGSTFSNYVGNTRSRFPEGKYFDIHTPLNIISSDFLQINYGTKDVLLKSTYCNTQVVEGDFLFDCKINAKMTYEEIHKRTVGRPCFSVGDAGFTTTMRKFLLDIFPEPSKFEQ